MHWDNSPVSSPKKEDKEVIPPEEQEKLDQIKKVGYSWLNREFEITTYLYVGTVSKRVACRVFAPSIIVTPIQVIRFVIIT